MVFADSVKASFGAGEDLRILHNGTDSFITNYTNDLYITNTADDKDIIFRSDDGSGSYTTYFLLDGSTAKTQFNRHLKIIDNMQIQVGTNPDMLLYHDGSNSYIDNSTGDLRIRGAYVKLQGLNGENMLVGNQNGNLELYHDNVRKFKTTTTGGEFEVGNGIVGTLKIQGGNTTVSAVGEVNARLDFGSNDGSVNSSGNIGGSIQSITEYNNGAWTGLAFFTFEQGSSGLREVVRMSRQGHLNLKVGDLQINGTSVIDSTKTVSNLESINMADGKYINIGSSSDLRLRHSTNSFIENYTGTLRIINYADDSDITFESDNGAGGVQTYFFLDGSAEQVVFEKSAKFTDSDKAIFGTGSDLEIYHDGSNSYIWEKGTGNLIVRGTEFRLQDSSGNQQLVTNSGAGVGLYHNASIKMETTSTGIDVTGTAVVDGLTSSGQLYVNTGDGVGSSGGIRLREGSNQSHRIYPDNQYQYNSIGSSDPNWIWLQEGGSQNARLYDTGFDLKQGAYQINGTTVIDSSRNVNNLESINMPDSKIIKLGTGLDLQIYHNGTNSFINNDTGDLFIKNFANDKDIIFQSDDGSGGVTDYLRIDGSTTSIVPFKDMVFGDGVKATFGTGSDLQIYHTGSHSYIYDTGTGNLVLKGQEVVIQSGNSSESKAIFRDDGAAELYFNDSLKIATTSTGIDVTGSTVTDGITLTGTGTDNDSHQINFVNGACAIARDNNDLDLHAYNAMVFGVSNTSYPTSTERMRIDSSGRVGIGTSSPSSILHLKDTVAQVKINSNDGQSAFLTFGDASDTTRGGLEYTSDDALVFETNNMQERMRISSAGFVGIGTNGPAVPLDVLGSGEAWFRIQTSDTNLNGIRLGSSTGSRQNAFYRSRSTDLLTIRAGIDDSDIQIIAGGSSNEIMRFDGTNSRVGIGTTSPSEKLHVIGNILTSGGVKVGDSSADALFLWYSKTRFRFRHYCYGQ